MASASTAAPQAAGAPGARRRWLQLDRVEVLCLLGLIALALAPLAALATKGRDLSGADGFLATDQMQYLAWIRESADHLLIGNPWDMAPGEARFLHPIFAISGALHDILGFSIPLSYLLWEPVAIAVVFAGAVAYVRRLLPAGGARHAGLVLVLFAVMPATAIVAASGWGGKPRQYSFDFISGEMWTGQYLWGYLPTAIAVFLIPLVLLGVERFRSTRRPGLLVACAAGTLVVAWLQPWQGAELVLIIWAVEAWRWARGRERPSWLTLAVVSIAGALPAAYYFWLSKVDSAWRLAGESNAAGAQDLWSWPWWAMLLTVLPLLVPALLAYRRSPDGWQDTAVRAWPLAVLVVYLLPFGTFPYHSFQGLQIPLSILAVLGVRQVWPRIPVWAVVLLLAVMVVPGTIHKADVFRNSVQSGGDPYFVFDGERELLAQLDRDPRRGGVLAPTYAALLVPSRTGRETWVGPFSWTPDWENRATLANDLFEGRLDPAQARRVVIASRARWLFADCRPLALARLESEIRPLLARPPQRFGCARLYEIKERPEMLEAAGPR
ncbi:MAG: hypothetical protein KGR19_02220 [Acidobacteria bacterium]|nr:hypothetical protein [Acidobacteriota bacterium]